MILSICDVPEVLKVMRLVNIIITIIRIAVPILLIVSVIISYMNAVKDNDTDALQKTNKTTVTKLVTAILVFLIPTFVSIIAGIFNNGEYKKCIGNITLVDIRLAYNDREEELVKKAEETTNVNDYYTAFNYLNNIDDDKRDEYAERLKKVKEIIDEKNKKEQEEATNKENQYAKVNYSNFKWTIYYSRKGPANKYYENILPYAVWGPENASDLNGVSLPLIIWLHGSGELAYNINIAQYMDRSLPKVVKNWSKTGLEPIPAIILTPQAAGKWADESNSTGVIRNLESIKALISSMKEIYNIDTNKIALMGHSLGGRGVTEVSYEMQKRYSTDYFSKLVVMSGGEGVIYPSRNSESAKAYFSKKDVRGYGEPDTATNKFFEWIGKPENYRLLSNASHGTVTEIAFKLDENKDGVSDLVYWLFGPNTVGVTKPQETQDSGSSKDTSSTTKPDSSKKPTARPIKDAVNIDSVNKAIANAAKSKGLYTREAVVNVAKTTVSQLKASNYQIPYQMGGMYHRGNTWGLNPAWGTIVLDDNEYVLAGLDCRNFVIWCMKQAGISLIRGFAEEGAITNKYGDRYSNFGDGRPGDVIDSREHIMLIVSNDKANKTYTVAESLGGYGVHIKTYTYYEIQNQVVNEKKIEYHAYNMDGAYNNTGLNCPSTSTYRPYKGSCHIPKSEFPSYYGF